jgi:hypothetical protein
MKSKLTLTKRRRLVLATVVICAVLIAGLGILWQSGKVSEAAVLNAHPGLMGWWRFDEVTGTVANDSSGNANSGTVYGAAIWVAGIYGHALSFNGVDNYVAIPYINLGTSALTYSLWFNTQSVNTQNLLSLMSTLIRISPGSIAWFCDVTQSVVYVGATINTNTWYNLVITQSGTTYTVYLNGTQIGTGTVVTINNGNLDNAIGAYGGTANFNGVIDEVRVYNRALYAAEVVESFQNVPDFSSRLLAKVPKATTDFIATVSWQGTGSISVTIQSPSQTYTEDMAAVAVYQKTTYSASSGTMLNIKRLEVSIGALASDQDWNVTLALNNVQDYKIAVEVQK